MDNTIKNNCKNLYQAPNTDESNLISKLNSFNV